MTRRPATLADVKAGDEVVVRSHYGRVLEMVTHATPTQIHIGRSKYTRNGRQMGDGQRFLRRRLTVEPLDYSAADLEKARADFAATTRPFTQSGVTAARAACDAAEVALRELGDWVDE